jgi:hypothetical protein
MRMEEKLTDEKVAKSNRESKSSSNVARRQTSSRRSPSRTANRYNFGKPSYVR